MANVREANAWRFSKVATLVRSLNLNLNDPKTINAATLPLRIRAGYPDEIGFRTIDLYWHRNKLIERAEKIKMEINNQNTRLVRLSAAVTRVSRNAADDMRKARRGGDALTVAAYNASAKASAEDLIFLRQKIKDVKERIRRDIKDESALRGAATLIGEVIEERTVRVAEAVKAPAPAPVVS